MANTQGRLRPPLLFCAIFLLAALPSLAQGGADERSPTSTQTTVVQNGLDVLAAAHFAELRALAPGRTVRVALVSNDASRDLAGRRAIDIFAHAEGVKLVRLFAPEHGSAARLDTEKIADAHLFSEPIIAKSVFIFG